MITLEEGKEWLRIDTESDQDDNLVTFLISASVVDIESSTGVPEDYKEKISEKYIKTIDYLYNMCQRIFITDMYYERTEENKSLNSFYIKLELEYRRAIRNEA